MSETQIQKIADQLDEALRDARSIPPIVDQLQAGDVDTAYAIQEINTARALAEGRRLVGRKIGLTSQKVQAQLGVDQCDFGMLFADMSVDENGTVPFGKLIQPKVEAEIGFVLKSDLTEGALTLVDIVNAIDYAVPCLEIVDSRIADWQISIVDTIADNASSGLFVTGTEKVDISALDLRLCGMVIELDGEPVSLGAGAACLGNPLNAVKWLAETMVRSGRPLKAGDLVLSGALGPMFPAKPGDSFEARISGLGSVRVQFETDTALAETA
ncbi:MAG: 2-keto-4-pentenoate hydratase [Ponticaulis sp.]|nr:2-keto-4-pentenoate hydratase [Ponticaulis sp.]